MVRYTFIVRVQDGKFKAALLEKGSINSLSKVADERRGDGFERKMVQGNWTCGKCSAEIKELPFEPDPSRLDQLLCRDCHRQRRQDFRR